MSLTLARNFLKSFPVLYRWRMRQKALLVPLTAHYPYEIEARIIRDIVPTGKAFFDIGAHDGFYGVLVEDILGSMNVYSFEPIPRTLQLLKQRRRSDRIFQLALSNQIGEQQIRIPSIEGQPFTTRATLETTVRELGETGHEVLMIETTTVDRFLAQRSDLALGFIKIDVEGHELAVLEGAQNTLKQAEPALMIEMEQRHHAQPLEQAFAYVEHLGYQGYYVDPTTLTLRQLSTFIPAQDQALENHKSGRYIQNFLFFPLNQASEFVQRTEVALQRERSRSSW